MYKVVYSEEAKKDLEEISLFIGKKYYEKFIFLIDNIVSLLEINPEMGVKLENGERQIVEPKYKYQIRYVIIGKEIYIMVIYKFKNR